MLFKFGPSVGICLNDRGRWCGAVVAVAAAPIMYNHVIEFCEMVINCVQVCPLCCSVLFKYVQLCSIDEERAVFNYVQVCSSVFNQTGLPLPPPSLPRSGSGLAGAVLGGASQNWARRYWCMLCPFPHPLHLLTPTSTPSSTGDGSRVPCSNSHLSKIPVCIERKALRRNHDFCASHTWHLPHTASRQPPSRGQGLRRAPATQAQVFSRSLLASSATRWVESTVSVLRVPEILPIYRRCTTVVFGSVQMYHPNVAKHVRVWSYVFRAVHMRSI